MGMVQIVTASDVVNAEIIKGFLSGCNIEAKYGPRGSGNRGSGGPNMQQTIFVEEDQADEALKLLKVQGLITS